MYLYITALYYNQLLLFTLYVLYAEYSKSASKFTLESGLVLCFVVI